jgi:hypothetical protein
VAPYVLPFAIPDSAESLLPRATPVLGPSLELASPPPVPLNRLLPTEISETVLWEQQAGQCVLLSVVPDFPELFPPRATPARGPSPEPVPPPLAPLNRPSPTEDPETVPQIA